MGILRPPEFPVRLHSGLQFRSRGIPIAEGRRRRESQSRAVRAQSGLAPTLRFVRHRQSVVATARASDPRRHRHRILRPLLRRTRLEWRVASGEWQIHHQGTSGEVSPSTNPGGSTQSSALHGPCDTPARSKKLASSILPHCVSTDSG